MAYTTRAATNDDLEAISQIYNHAVETSTSTFDMDPPDLDYWRLRLDGQHPGDHLLVAADEADEPVGYAYSWSFRPRPGYDFSRETSIYLDEAVRGRGVGRMLYPALLETMSIAGVHTAIAAVALPNPASEALHVACGFKEVGRFAEVGRKFDEWIDVKWYQRMLVNLPITGRAVDPG